MKEFNANIIKHALFFLHARSLYYLYMLHNKDCIILDRERVEKVNEWKSRINVGKLHLFMKRGRPNKIRVDEETS